ncbi:multidrug ABC transporter permease [candidate division MSBL1 archaeon SCGC-AAA259M10]|uniref:Multidrug ABC transporter permease n=1 Tax=candidate division MSBL1 archaeon SCGC-AAA259M10 TaxID=1698270 RepID=A0A133UZG6_9EURY|nr:multidrug ABC transporter permease [candidate division MSBL1 archaeon SCGC-AAA259M10]
MGIKKGLTHSFWVAWKDLLELWRNKIALVMLVLMHLFMMAMVGFIFPSQNSMQGVHVAVANLDEGGEGGMLINQLEMVNEEKGLMKLKRASSLQEARQMIVDGEISAAIIIPENFTSSLRQGKQGEVLTVTDQSNPQMSSMLSRVLERVIGAMGTQRAVREVSELIGGEGKSPIAIVEPYRIETKGVVEGETSYFDFVAPGIMAMVVMMAVMTGLPRAISYEKDKGTLDGFLVSPISRMSIIAGKVFAQTTRGLIQGAIILLLAMILFGVTIHCSVAMVFLLLFLGVFSFIGLGIVLTTTAEDEQTAMMIMMTLMFPMMFLSGVFFPLEQMPGFMQFIAKFLPLTYAAEALRKAMIFGTGLGGMLTDILILAAFGTIMLTVSIPLFKRAMTR